MIQVNSAYTWIGLYLLLKSFALHACVLRKLMILGYWLGYLDQSSRGWRKMHNDKLHNFYSSPDSIRTINSRKMRSAYKTLVTLYEGKKSLGRHKRKWKGYIKMHRWQIGLEGEDWINLARYKDQWPAFLITVLILQIS